MDLKLFKGPLITGAKILWRHSDHVAPFLRSQLYRSKSTRISIAAIARIEVDGKFLLVRNRHRPGYFGPLGGVIKYYPSALPILDSFDFQKEAKSATDPDLEFDLRGKIPGAKLGLFLLWLNEQKDRESSTDALRREIMEESRETDMSLRVQDALEPLRYRLIRTIHEGPYVPHSLTFPQYRRIQVFSAVSDSFFDKFREQYLADENAPCVDYCLASIDEIEKGRLSGCQGEGVSGMEVLPNTSYLFKSQIQKNEAAPI